MKQLSCLTIFSLLITVFFSCSAPQYFHDPSSLKRQKELRNTRSANVFSDILIGVSTVCVSAALESDIYFEPHEQAFKKLNLLNPTKDTMYVNMLTDLAWDENNYCDFMDIRIPPKMTGKVMVPINANYHLYFSTTLQDDDDELLEIFTSDIKKITLSPGMTNLSPSRK